MKIKHEGTKEARRRHEVTQGKKTLISLFCNCSNVRSDFRFTNLIFLCDLCVFFVSLCLILLLFLLSLEDRRAFFHERRDRLGQIAAVEE